MNEPTRSGNEEITGRCDHCWLENFQSLRNSTSEVWEEILNKKNTAEFRKGEALLHPGHLVSGIYCVKEGMVKIARRSSKGKEFVLWIAGPGDLVGLHSFINNEPLGFSASAINQVKACFVPSAELKVLLEKEPLVFVKLTSKLCEKLNYVEQRITSISKKKIREQCAELLVSMARQIPPARDKTIHIQYPVKDLASLIGTTRSYMYKIIADLVNTKVISMHNRKLIINNLNRLSSIAMGNDN